MKRLKLLGFFLLLAGTAHAGYLVQGATITEVANTGSNQAKFTIRTTGGTGPCVGSTYIFFPASAAVDESSFSRAYAAALIALTTGMKVDILNYSSDSCDGAAFIGVKK